MSQETFWVPLESNPAVLTRFSHLLGVPEHLGFSDCFGLDDELLAMVPQPCSGIIFLYPYSKIQDVNENTEFPGVIENNPKVYFMKQIVNNACGTIALVHVLANNKQNLQLGDGFFKDFLESTQNVDSENRGNLFGSQRSLEHIHSQLAAEGQTAAPDATAEVDYHFVAFVNVDNTLYELDGMKGGPVNHGPTTTETFLKDATAVIKSRFIDRLEGEMAFNILTFGPLQ